jgi:hypothetical protein
LEIEIILLTICVFIACSENVVYCPVAPVVPAGSLVEHIFTFYCDHCHEGIGSPSHDNMLACLHFLILVFKFLIPFS